MKPCPECNSNNVHRYKEYIDPLALAGSSSIFLPKLTPNFFSSGSSTKYLPVVCMDCGHVRFFASKEALNKIDSSGNWKPI